MSHKLGLAIESATKSVRDVKRRNHLAITANFVDPEVSIEAMYRIQFFSVPYILLFKEFIPYISNLRCVEYISKNYALGLIRPNKFPRDLPDKRRILNIQNSLI